MTIIQSFSISLGVGSSTLAIVNFFAAIEDGTIDETERRMMGIVYIVLRVAIGLILFTSFILSYQSMVTNGLTGMLIGQVIALAVLFINAALMTMRIMPSTFGPAIQAGSWYTLGTLSALQIVGVTDFTLAVFLMGYVTWLILAVGIVNGIMAILKAKKA
jgi:hypothetical protein